MLFFAIIFNETRYVVKTSTTVYVHVSYEVINLFIKLQNFMFFFFDSLLMLFLYFVCELLLNMRKQHIKTMLSEVFTVAC